MQPQLHVIPPHIVGGASSSTVPPSPPMRDENVHATTPTNPTTLTA
jgi:hypothetical protein